MSDINLAYKCSEIIEEEGYKGALVGGVAISVWCEERFTKDLDFALVVRSDKDAENLTKKMKDRGFIIDKIFEHKPTNSLALVILNSPKNEKIPFRLDLLFMQTGIEKEVVDNSIVFDIDNNKSLRVASKGYLIALKTLSMDDTTRPQDRLDLKNLLKIATEKDLKLAREAIRLITNRGFNQSKNLLDQLKELERIYKNKGSS